MLLKSCCAVDYAYKPTALLVFFLYKVNALVSTDRKVLMSKGEFAHTVGDLKPQPHTYS